ncbi:RNA polymerase I-specific transcription initiation factor RRN6-like protein [Podospora didyma]|uniref:RNA polymerase I-specific transcription initiation factor RRN6-like protein n=1 Tax=Podospora didyma TaxID=330526 RepID=A0AAE0U159_9PEZI|nr:RNA polymerase I-specific transcription initiation factor RRN6-like protein [Podospora didyma]
MADSFAAHRTPGLGQNRRPRLDGIAGRFVYVPAQNGEVAGKLHRNCANGQTPHFQQVTSFTQWCPPIPTIASQFAGLKLHQVTTSQSNWLVKQHPQAYMGDSGAEAPLRDAISTAQANARRAATPETSATCLMSFGEISDVRIRDKVKGHLALAVSSRELGHVLHLIGLSKEEWSWADEDVRVRLSSLDSQLTGEWWHDKTPISLVKFAADLKRPDPIRWLLVQKATSTTVCAPELRDLPLQVALSTKKSFYGSGPVQIVANPLFTIRSVHTGGASQSDVAFRPGSGVGSPQLAIIDKSGNWSVWETTNSRVGQAKILKPILKICGNIFLGSLPNFPSKSAKDREQYRIMWLSLGHIQFPLRSRSRSISHSQRFNKSVDQDASGLLLMCNSTSLYLFDIANERAHSVSDVVLPPKTIREHILDWGQSLSDPTQAFVLTSSNLVWVAAREGHKGSICLDALATCPHRKDSVDPGLRLNVSPATYLNGLEAFFVCVRATRDARMAIFWFIKPEPGTPVKYHRELVTLRAPFTFMGMDMLPVTRRTPRVSTNSTALGNALIKARPRFFQIVTLGVDLDVHCSLCVWSDEPNLQVRPPDTRIDNLEPTNEHLDSKHLGDAFVVPDEFQEPDVNRNSGERKEPESMASSAPEARRKRIRFKILPQMAAAREELGMEDMRRPRGKHEKFKLEIINEAIEQELREGYMPRHSLLELVGRGKPASELLHLASEWTTIREDLAQPARGLLIVPEPGRLFSRLDLDGFSKIVGNMFSGRHRSDIQLGQKAVLQRIAAELFLSKVGISVLPQGSSSTPAQKPTGPNSFDDNMFSSSVPFQSSPSAAASSQMLPLPSSPMAPPLLDSFDVGTAVEDNEDDVPIRLRKYITTEPLPPMEGGKLLIYTHWELGEDPDEPPHWKPGDNDVSEDKATKRKRKVEALRRKKAALTAKIFMKSEGDQAAVSQPLPNMIKSSQIRPSRPSIGIAKSSQPRPSLQALPESSQPVRSQVLPGAFGGRPKKKPPRQSMGFR